ncbi:hypothetical protein AX17_001847 [Amanita inopinata Kibby_2008]|nr:hypothetical protein AX17_001847 [Amanita inopinata Kibby_2008]
MEQLRALSSLARLSDSVVRVLAQNPGRFTLQGTNTYIVGKENPYILIDTGEGRDDYLPLLESALRELAQPTNPTQPDISDIIISHWHHDHVGGLPTVLSLLRKRWEARKTGFPYQPPRLHKLPLPTEAAPAAHSSFHTLPSVVKSLSRDLFTPAPDGNAFHALYDGQLLPASTASPLCVLHTPGHTADSICIYMPSDRALYTADTVLGQGTAVFEDLSAYLSSLNKMLGYIRAQEQNTFNLPVSLYPGHGPVLSDGARVIDMYIKHRLEREAQIIHVLQNSPPSDTDAGSLMKRCSDERARTHWTTWSIVGKMYATYPEPLWVPAARGIDLHLQKLEADGVVERLGGDGTGTRWALTQNK